MNISCEKCGYHETYQKKLTNSETVTLECKGCGDITRFRPAEKAAVESVRGGVRWHNRLQVRFCGVLLFATIVIGGTFMAFEYYFAKKEISSTLDNLAEISAIRMSKYLVEPLWGLEEEQMSESLKSEMLDKEIESIVIYERNPDSVLLGKTRDENWHLLATSETVESGKISKKRPIARNGTIIGDVEVTVTDKFALSKLNESILRLSLATVSLCAVLLIFITIILRSLIVAPINLVMKAADQISTGDIDAEIRYSSPTEIGLLVESIKRMQVSFQIAYKMIKRKRR